MTTREKTSLRHCAPRTATARRWVHLHTLHQRDLSGVPQSAGTARAWTVGLLAEHVTVDVLETTTLLVSELITNAVVHSDSSRPGGTVTLCLGIGYGIVHVEVIDDGSAVSVPTMRAAGEDSDGGRGLNWVNLLADCWGSDQDDEVGNAVWFQISYPTDQAPVAAPTTDGDRAG